jgi:hypothetical protein
VGQFGLDRTKSHSALGDSVQYLRELESHRVNPIGLCFLPR